MVVFSLSYAIVGRTCHNHQSFSQALANGFDSTYVSFASKNYPFLITTTYICKQLFRVVNYGNAYSGRNQAVKNV